MVDETIRYNVEIDTATISQQLSQLRQQIDEVVASTGIGGDVATSVSTMGTNNMVATAHQNAGLMQQMMDRTEGLAHKNMQQLKASNFSYDIATLSQRHPMDRSTLENIVESVIGFGYDPSKATMSFREYTERARQEAFFKVPFLSDEYVGNERTANWLQDVSRASIGGRLERGDARRLARTIRNLDLEDEFYQQGFTRQEVGEIVYDMAAAGDFTSTESAGEIENKIRESLGSMRRVMQDFKVVGEEAVQLQGAIRNLGIDASEVGNVSSYLSSTGGAVGLSAKDMLVAAQTGGSLAAIQGVDPSRAIGGWTNLLSDIRFGGATGAIDKWRINALGGEAGAMTAIGQTSAGFFNSGLGVMALGDGTGPSGIEDLFRRQALGDEISSTDPELGSLMLLDRAAEIYRMQTGKNPNDDEVIRMATVLQPNADRNALMVTLQNTRGTSQEEAGDIRIEGLTNMYEDRLDAAVKQLDIPLVKNIKGVWRNLTEGWGMGSNAVRSWTRNFESKFTGSRVLTEDELLRTGAPISVYSRQEGENEDGLQADLLGPLKSGEITEEGFLEELESISQKLRRSTDQEFRTRDSSAFTQDMAPDVLDYITGKNSTYDPSLELTESEEALRAYANLGGYYGAEGIKEFKALFDIDSIKEQYPDLSDDYIEGMRRNRMETVLSMGSESLKRRDSSGDWIGPGEDPLDYKEIFKDVDLISRKHSQKNEYIEDIKALTPDQRRAYLGGNQTAMSDMAITFNAEILKGGLPVVIKDDQSQ